jgi:hypothetical protein
MYDLCMFIRYLVSLTKVLKNTEFVLDNWCECGNLLFIIILVKYGRLRGISERPLLHLRGSSVSGKMVIRMKIGRQVALAYIIFHVLHFYTDYYPVYTFFLLSCPSKEVV